MIMQSNHEEKRGYLFNIQKFCLHDGPGIRTALFFSGCNLVCKWCANPECRFPVSDARSEAKPYSVGELVSEVLKDKAFYDKSGGGVTLTGGEVFLQFEFASELCRALRASDISVAVETAGCVEVEKFRKLAACCDFVYIDCKHYDGERHREGTGADNGLILNNLAYLAASDIPYCVRIPIIPGYNDREEDAQGFCRLFRRLGIQNVELLPFHQFGEGKYETLKLEYAYHNVPGLHREDLENYRNVFRKSGIDAAIGD